MSSLPKSNMGKSQPLSAKQLERIEQKGLQALLRGKVQVGILPTITILAKALATEMTNINIKNKDLQGEQLITQQHISSNLTIRQALANENIIPENLPAEEDIKKVERRVKAQTKKSLQESGKLEE